MRSELQLSRIIEALCVVVALFSFSSSAQSQWQIVAPNLLGRLDSNMGCLTYKAGVLWAGHRDTLWKSTDTGSTWRRIPLPLITSNASISDINFFDQLNGLVGTLGGGIFNKRWWEFLEINFALEGSIVSAIRFHRPTNLGISLGSTRNLLQS